jgi:hypothetical protein
MILPVERKPQQQTLSIRINETLREFLERSRVVFSLGRGEAVSTSDVAKILLESAKDDRLDSRLEVAELLQHPTESMCAVRTKWEKKQPLSRAEWILIGQYIQIACEEVSEDPEMPGPSTFVMLLEALLAVRKLRGDRGVGLDRYYLGNLGMHEGPGLTERQFDPELLPEIVRGLIDRLRQAPPPPKPAFAGRSFFVALRDEVIEDVIALNHALGPQAEALLRLAARGHWIREKRPLRVGRDGAVVANALPRVSAPGFQLQVSINSDREISFLIFMDEKDVMYPIGTYPQIREFSAMLHQMPADRNWHGIHFWGFTAPESANTPERYYFYRRSDSITFGFSEQERQTLAKLIVSAMETPALKATLDELTFVYGEL